MGSDLWKLIRDGKGTVATHAVFAAAVKHSPLLGDFLAIVVGEQYRLFSPALSPKMLLKLHTVHVADQVLHYLKANREEFVLRCIQVAP